jgi:hypothetical protein
MRPLTHDAEINVLDAPSEARQLSEWLQHGKSELGWRGDPRLFLVIGQIIAPYRMVKDGKIWRKGDVMGVVFEVRRHNEDGTDKQILVKPVQKWHEIIPALIGSDPRTPGFEPVMDTIEREAAALEKQKSDEFQGHYGEMWTHMHNVVSERLNGKSFFPVADNRPKQD